jgi:formate dehydrogenase iron-sulfur subunit
MTTMAILTDVTRCIGCEECVAACRQTNDTGSDAPYRWQGGVNDLSSTRWTTLVETENRFVRRHCRHCLDPACAAACPVGALKKTEQGPVAYDPVICMGCRYCMVACPFQMTRYEWESATPRVRKCILCYDKIIAGELSQPACTAVCPTEATIFGEREELLAEARSRIAAAPDRYIDHIWGEHEVGGTSVLTISDVDLAAAGWAEDIGTRSRPALARKVLHTVPYTFFGVAGLMYGVHWTLDRRRKVAAAEGPTLTTDAEGVDERRTEEES